MQFLYLYPKMIHAKNPVHEIKVQPGILLCIYYVITVNLCFIL